MKTLNMIPYHICLLNSENEKVLFQDNLNFLQRKLQSYEDATISEISLFPITG